MPIQVNAVYVNNTTFEEFRVLCLFPQEDRVAVIALKRNTTVPNYVCLSNLEASISDGQIQIKTDDASYLLPDKMKQTHIDCMNKKWEIISSFVLNEPSCFIKKNWSTFISIAAHENNVPRLSIQRYLYQYWAGGRNKYSLLPDYRNNGKKINRKTDTSKKLGRPRKHQSSNFGMNITDEEKAHIRIIINAYYNKDGKHSMSKCYERYLSQFAMDERYSQTLKPQYLTKRQFVYNAAPFINERKRQGAAKFDRNCRAITGNSRSEARGPGDTYQIDATIADIYLVSRNNPNILIGRPVLYFVTDVFSRMITGFAVGLSGPSWEGAMSALYNMVWNKVDLCRKYGIEIFENEWPCEGIPAKLLVDNGEMISKASNGIVLDLGIQIENTPAWRPDLKGIVENSFRLMNGQTKEMLPGSVYPDFTERGGPDYRMDATLTLNEFIKVVITYIRKSNTRMMSKHPQLAEDIIRDHVPAVPLDLWNWGIKNRGGLLRQVVDDRVKIALMKKEKAIVTPSGIRFQKLYYTSHRAEEEDWFSNARVRGTWQIDIAYDPRGIDTICLLFDNGDFEYAKRVQDSNAAFRGWTFEEIGIWYQYDMDYQKSREKEILENSINFNKNIDEIVETARVRSKVIPINGVRHIKGKDVRANRKKELIHERKIVCFSPQDGEKTSSTPLNETMNDQECELTDYSKLLRQYFETGLRK